MKILSGLAIALGLATVWATPTFAVEARNAEDGVPVPTAEVENISEPHATFAVEAADETAQIKFGHNLIYAGNNMSVDVVADGLLFSFGNNIQIKSYSDYAFVAGNVVNFTAGTERDVFIAGNLITLDEGAKIGRDVFATGNAVSVKADLSGDFSASASSVSFENVVINGNVNIAAATLQFSGNVEITGKLTYNDDITVIGIENVTYAELEIYETVDHDSTAGEVWLAKFMSMCGLFITLVIIALVFSHFKQLFERESTTSRFGMNLLRGAGVLIATPLLILVILISFFAASAGVALLGVYVLIIYLAQALSGAWVGYVLAEKVCRIKLPIILEGAIGIVILGCLSMIPGLGFVVALFSILLGSGLLVSWVRPAKNLPASETTLPKAGLKNPFRGQKKSTASSKRTASKSVSKPASKKSSAKAATNKKK